VSVTLPSEEDFAVEGSPMASNTAFEAADVLSFRCDAGATSPGFRGRVHEARIRPVRGRLFVYCTFDMCPANPFPYEKGVPKFVRDAAAGPAGSATFEEELVQENKADATSSVARPLLRISDQGGRSFRTKPATRFGAKRPPVSG
jgi:hypothetical protein